ncbi:hypothetical protein V8F06_009334 [Rhypophila decipiens]
MFAISYLTLLVTLLHHVAHQAQASPVPFGPASKHNHPPSKFPVRILAGVRVPDTPIIRAAQSYAHSEVAASTYNHVNRAWLWATLIVQHNKTLQSLNPDLEVLAVASILHDLGTDRRPNSPHVSKDKRFEVDGAISARRFIRSHPDGKKWDERRVQMIWDAIALHSEAKYALWKELEVEIAYRGNEVEFSGGEKYGITEEEKRRVMDEFPDKRVQGSVIDFQIWLCTNKPESTYDTYMQPFGEMFVPGYSAVGHRSIDRWIGTNTTKPGRG